MISKSGRISPNPSANPVARSKRLISISLCLVALVAGVFLLREVIAARQNPAKQMVAPVTGDSSEAKIPVAKSAGKAPVPPSAGSTAGEKNRLALEQKPEGTLTRITKGSWTILQPGEQLALSVATVRPSESLDRDSKRPAGRNAAGSVQKDSDVSAQIQNTPADGQAVG